MKHVRNLDYVLLAKGCLRHFEQYLVNSPVAKMLSYPSWIRSESVIPSSPSFQIPQVVERDF